MPVAKFLSHARADFHTTCCHGPRTRATQTGVKHYLPAGELTTLFLSLPALAQERDTLRTPLDITESAFRA
jgi:hypothetical protein